MTETPDLKAEGLGDLEKMRQGVDYTFHVKMRAFRCPMRPLAISELQEVTNQVLMDLSGVPETLRHSLSESSMLAKGILEKSCSRYDGTKVGPLTGAILERMTTDELLCLYDQYLAGVDGVNPKLEDMSLDDLKELVERVKKNQIPLTALSTSEALNLVRYLLPRD